MFFSHSGLQAFEIYDARNLHTLFGAGRVKQPVLLYSGISHATLSPG